MAKGKTFTLGPVMGTEAKARQKGRNRHRGKSEVERGREKQTGDRKAGEKRERSPEG